MNETAHCRIVLASGSPRRREILTQLSVDFRVAHPSADELADGLPPEELACENARRKALSVELGPVRPAAGSADPCLNEAVLGVDTIVVLGGVILGKPRDAGEAEGMLEALSGRTHEVISGLHLEAPTRGAGRLTLGATTRVTFRRLDRSMVRWYAATGEGLDKAGAYGIQGLGALLVDRIDGCYFNVVGFPVGAFLDALSGLTIPLSSILTLKTEALDATVAGR